MDRRQWVSKRSDRRTLARLPEAIPILLSPEEDIFKEFRESTVNISTRGLQVQSTREFPIGAKVDLCLYPRDLFVPIQVQGQIVWRKYDVRNKIFRYGFSFKDVTGEYQSLLDQFLSKKIDERLRNEGHASKRLSHFFYNGILRNILKRSLIGQRAVTGRSDSGFTFDHIYGNRAKGSDLIGRVLDRAFLSLPAAKASRFRKDLIKEALQHEIRANTLAGQMTHILDLGSGTARYLIETIGAEEASHVEALCVDRDSESIRSGKLIAGNRPMRFLQLDIFKVRRLEALSEKIGWKPNVIIVSGLIYYFSDKKVKVLLNRMHDWLAPGGTLIITNMIQNPNKKLIGNLFITQGGDPWIPLARPIHLVRSWLAEAGFSSPHHATDPWGMYSVFSAKKDKENVKARSLEFRSQSSLLRGKNFLAVNSRKIDGVVLFVHGLGYTYTSYRLNPTFFSNSGLHVAMYNMAGHGNSSGEWNLDHAISTVSRAVDQLIVETRKDLPIYLLAHSTGALIALLAALKDRRVRAAALVNVVTSVTDSYYHWHKSGYNQQVKEYFKTSGIVPPIINSFLDDLDVMKQYQRREKSWADLEFPYRYGLMRASSFVPLAQAICFSPDLLTLAKEIKFPVILFCGKKDDIIPVEKTDQLAKLLSGPHEVVKTSSSDHFQMDQWGLIQSKAVEFFREAAKL